VSELITRGTGHDPAQAGPAGSRPRVAIAHDYLTQRGGAERVVLEMARAFPEARIYTTLYDPAGTFPEFADLPVVVSPLNRVGWLRRHHRLALPLLPLAARFVRPRAEVVLASTSGFAHGFRADGLRLVYCHAPARWIYQADDYVGDRSTGGGTRLVLRALTPALRAWDQRAAAAATRYLVNSRVVRDRVRAAYGIEATVLAPPFGLDPAAEQRPLAQLVDWAEPGYHLVVSRLLPYKHVEQAVAAFGRMPQRRLVVVGDGPGAARVTAMLPRNVRLVSSLGDAELRWIYAHSTALVAPSFEDFGLTPLEAGIFGKPTVALEGGGYLDTVEPGVTGVFFPEPTPEAIAAAVERAAAYPWSVEAIRDHAASFGPERFAAALVAEVDALLGGATRDGQ